MNNASRSDIAKKAALERWNPTIPKATHSGILIIAGKEIYCDVLEDGRRILRQKTVNKAMGKARPSGDDMKRSLDSKIPVFVVANNLIPYLEEDFIKRGQEILFRSVDGRRTIGYEASILPEACKIYAKAEDDGVLLKNQLPIAKICRSILYGLATVGIISLVDEASNYQEVRERNELQIILDKYISEELRQWTRKFPQEFFKQVYKLYGWENPLAGKHPKCLGNFINKYIYDKLPEGVLDELKRKNPKNENGNRHFCHHQFLTPIIGDDNLTKQIVQTITIMKLSKNIDEFKENIDRLED